MSEAVSGEKHPRYGKHCSAVTKKKIGLKNSKAVVLIDIITKNVIKDWNSLTDASKDTGIHMSYIVNCCKGRIKSYKGLYFRYKDAIY